MTFSTETASEKEDRSGTISTKDSIVNDWKFIGNSVDSEARGQAADNYAHEKAIRCLELDEKRLRNQIIEEQKGHLSEVREMRLSCSKHAIWIAWIGTGSWLLAFISTAINNFLNGRILLSDHALTVIAAGSTIHLSVAFTIMVKGLFLSETKGKKAVFPKIGNSI